jgi:hypothetical protein
MKAGRKLVSWAQDRLANRYADRTHFVFELLQNAEDALRKETRKRAAYINRSWRGTWQSSSLRGM